MSLEAFHNNAKCVITMSTARANPRHRRIRAAVFKALGHPARLHIVEELAAGERCVCDLVDLVGLGWSAVSRHLAVLKQAGVLEDEKRGLQVFYRLAPPGVGSCTDRLSLNVFPISKSWRQPVSPVKRGKP
jgi:ArsR family transcriptional regulator